jgi:hypothetical protein
MLHNAGFNAHLLKPVHYPELSLLLGDFSGSDAPVDVADCWAGFVESPV